MRVLMTTDTAGGVWTFAQQLADGLLRRGCPVCLVSFGGRASDAQRRQCADMSQEWKVQFQFIESDIPLEWMSDNHCAYPGAAPLLVRTAREFQADVVLSSQFCFGALPLTIPKVIVAHSDVLSWAEACRDGELEDSMWLRRYCQMVANGLARADAVVAPTRWMLDALARNFALPAKTAVIPNGRSLPSADQRARKLQAVTAGRLWDEAKNISMLRDVRLPLPVLIAGEDPRLSAAISGAKFLGLLPQDALLNLFRESSIYICTSCYEPFGLAPLEAALCGCAVVANNIPSLREVWQDGALYFSGADALTSVLEKLAAAPDELEEAQERALRRAQSFSSERMANGYRRLLRDVLARNEESVCAA